MNNTLVMKYPAAWHGDMWREGAPCGNGITGALVYGGLRDEIILLNHARLWRGGHICELPDIHENLDRIRRLLDERRPDLADGVFSGALREKGYNADNALPLPLCDIRIHNHSQKPFFKYRRVIDMAAAEVCVSWREEDVNYRRSTFVSRDNGLCYVKIEADRGGMICADFSLDTHDTETIGEYRIKNAYSHAENGCIFYAAANESAYAPANGDYGAVCRIVAAGGSMSEAGSRITVKGADSVTLVIALFVGTPREDGFGQSMSALDTAVDYDRAMAAHERLHYELYGTVNFEISSGNHSNEELLTDAFENGASNELIEKLYACGRYLFVCSTAEHNALPVHLTGLWNGTYQCFWAIYMYNVNFEMIYWQALSGNLPSLLRPALDYTESFTDHFRENARKLFGCRGIYINSVNTPESGLCACIANHIINWTAGAAWFAQHFYDYWRYTGDDRYLREHALPFMYEAALFYEDFLYAGADGCYVIAPSTSPENVPSSTKELFGSDAQISRSASMDIAAIGELLENILECAKKCGMYGDKYIVWEKMLDLLPPYKTNDDGSLREWADDFYTDNNAHRHHSHMYGVFPGHSVRPGDGIYGAFVKAEDKRIEEGLSSQSSWSMVYMACVNARMERGNIALSALSDMARTCCMNNLFTVHNDWRRMGPVYCDDFRIAPFQIDANIGLPAAVNEMLLNCSGDDIILLPALPDAWPEGKLEGLAAPGRLTVSITWDKQYAHIIINAPQSTAVKLRCGDRFTFPGGSAHLDAFLETGRNEFQLPRRETI